MTNQDQIMSEKNFTDVEGEVTHITVDGETFSLEEFVSKLAIVKQVLADELDLSIQIREREAWSYPMLKGIYEVFTDVYYPLAKYVYRDNEKIYKYL